MIRFVIVVADAAAALVFAAAAALAAALSLVSAAASHAAASHVSGPGKALDYQSDQIVRQSRNRNYLSWSL